MLTEPALGWLPEEFAVAGVPLARRGAGFAEHLAAMRACWAVDPVEHAGPCYRIPRSEIGAKSVNGDLPVLEVSILKAGADRASQNRPFSTQPERTTSHASLDNWR